MVQEPFFFVWVLFQSLLCSFKLKFAKKQTVMLKKIKIRNISSVLFFFVIFSV